MIKNEREYRITRNEARRFQRALESAAARQVGDDENLHALAQVQADAIRSQLETLQQEVTAYEQLREGRVSTAPVQSVGDLANALIKARIAAGMTQQDLAEAVGLHAQQIQRYEASSYACASLARLEEVAQALRIQLSEDVILPTPSTDLSDVMRRAEEVGLESGFVLDSLMDEETRAYLETGEADTRSIAVRVADAISRVYRWNRAELFGSQPLNVSHLAMATARFKAPRGVNERVFHAYVVYAHYLALQTLACTEALEPRPIPSDPMAVREEILESEGELSFAAVLSYVWSRGIAVLPLSDTGAFHGAMWRAKGRNVIVLKQTNQSLDRWTFDLLHELFHCLQEPDQDSRSVVEDSDPLMRDVTPDDPDDEEDDANFFASDVLLGGHAEELVEEAVRRAAGATPRLKSAVLDVARDAGVPVGALANYVAWRLSLQRQNWWGTANNLQDTSAVPWSVARDQYLLNVRLDALGRHDSALLERALSSTREG